MTTSFFSDKTLLVVVTVVGMAMCSVGIGQVAERGAWLQPMSIVAYFIGALTLVIAGAGLFNITLPVIDSTRTAWIAVIALAVLKVALTQLHHLLAWT